MSGFKVSGQSRKDRALYIVIEYNKIHSWFQLAGNNSHHIVEATFKAFARALRQATEYDPRRLGTIPRSVLAVSPS